MQHRQERVHILTAQHRITGSLTLARDGYRSRLSDLLNSFERDFLALTDVVVEPIAGGEQTSHEFVAVSRRHIVFAVPVEDAAEGV